MPIEQYTSPADQGTIVIEEERLQEGWTTIPNTILRRADVTPGAKLTYVMLLSYAHQKGSCFPGQVTLAQDLGAGERSVRRYLQELESIGLLAVQRRGLGRTNLYILTRWASGRAAKLADQDRPQLTVLKRPNWQAKKEKSEEIQDHHHDIVDELTAFGIERDVARQLARDHEPDYLRDRLARVRFLADTSPSAIRKTPQAFLVAAIKHPGIDPAPRYKAPAELQAAAQAKNRAQAEAEAVMAAEHHRAEQERAAERQHRANAAAAVRRAHPSVPIPGTQLSTDSAWHIVLERLRMALQPTDYTAWLSESILVSFDGTTAILATHSGFAASWLSKRFDKNISKELAAIIGQPVALRYVAFADLVDSPSITDGRPQRHQAVASTQSHQSVHPR